MRNLKMNKINDVVIHTIPVDENANMEHLSRVVMLWNQILENEKVPYNISHYVQRKVQIVGASGTKEKTNSIVVYTYTLQDLSDECRNRLSRKNLVGKIDYLTWVLVALSHGEKLKRHEMSTINEIYKQLIVERRK